MNIVQPDLHAVFDPPAPGCAWIVRFDAQGHSSAGTSDDLTRIGAVEPGFIWVHLNLSDVRSRQCVESVAALSDTARQILVGPVDHQMLDHSGDMISGALADFSRDLTGTTDDVDFLRFCFGHNFLFSARRHPLQSVEATRSDLARGARMVSPLALFETLANHICNGLAGSTRMIAHQIDVMEERVLDEDAPVKRTALGALRRSILKFARQIDGFHAGLERIEIATEEPDHEVLADTAARLVQRAEALTRDIASLQNRARLLQDEINAKLTMQTNDRLFVLTIVTTLLLPATFVTGYFGMNTKGLLFSDNESGTLYATLLCFAASGLIWLIMRRTGLTESSEHRAAQAKAAK